MWVRSQNKEVLYDINHALLRDFQHKSGFAITTKVNVKEEVILGEYSTKEQALEILDEIQERINEGCPFVYQMPEDEPDVELTHVPDYTEQELEIKDTNPSWDAETADHICTGNPPY